MLIDSIIDQLAFMGNEGFRKSTLTFPIGTKNALITILQKLSNKAPNQPEDLVA
jgi:hypothetical protein